MYLSRVRLDAENRRTMIALSNPQKIHGAVESAFPGERERNLWRIAELGGTPYLLILSHERADFTDVVRQFGYDGDSYETKSYDGLLARVQPESRWRFRLTANPTKCFKAPTDPSPRGKIGALISVAQQEQWLAERAAGCGFRVKPGEFRVTHSRSYAFKKTGKRAVALLSVTFDGILTVADPELFRKALVSGIGRGKAYGNGLLTITRTEECANG